MRFVSVQVKSTMHRRSPCAKRPRPCFAVNLRGGDNRTYHRPNFHCLGPYVIPKDIWYIVPFVLVTTQNEGSRSFRHYKYSAAAGVNTGTINVTPPANPNLRVLTYRCNGIGCPSKLRLGGVFRRERKPLAPRHQSLLHQFLDSIENFVFAQIRGVENHGILGGDQRRSRAGAVPMVALAKLRSHRLRRRAFYFLLVEAPLFANHGIGVEKNL